MEVCESCHSNNTDKICGYCTKPTCKKCVVYCDLELNEWYKNQKDIHHSACPDCNENVFTPIYEKFESDMNEAKSLPIWPITYRGKIPISAKSSQLISVKDVKDRKLALLKMAFNAVELGFNALSDVEIKQIKIRDHGYQKMLYNGTSKAIMADRSKLIDPESIDSF